MQKRFLCDQGILVSAITVDEHGEMVVLDDDLWELVSGGASKPKAPAPAPPPSINVVCGTSINFSCSPNPPPSPAPKPGGAFDEQW